MITIEDIENVIHRIRYGGDGLDPLMLAVEYLTVAKGWKLKAERHGELKNLVKRLNIQLEQIGVWERNLKYLEITEEQRNELREILEGRK